jgi:hypothetical protein
MIETLIEFAWDALFTITVLGSCFAIMLSILIATDAD